MGSKQFVNHEAISNVEKWLADRGMYLKRKSAKSVLPSSYRPELDDTKYLDQEFVSYHQEQIGVLRWMVELGRVDICCEVSMLAAYCAAPRKGHLEAVIHMFAYLKGHAKSQLVFNSDTVLHSEPSTLDWSDFYKDAQDTVPRPDMPEPLGEPVQLNVFVDSDHAGGDTVTRRSRTGVIIFVNKAPIIWYSKKQGSIETSSFGSEFMAMKTAVEMTEGLRYKLRMMGVPLDGPANVMADNMSVVKNTSIPESVLKKKSNSIAYHYVRERAAAGMILVRHERTDSNIADILTKIQPHSVRERLLRLLFMH